MKPNEISMLIIRAKRWNKKADEQRLTLIRRLLPDEQQRVDILIQREIEDPHSQGSMIHAQAAAWAEKSPMECIMSRIPEPEATLGKAHCLMMIDGCRKGLSLAIAALETQLDSIDKEASK